ncbi:NACHT domain-containing protein [Streptomyces mutabilis]|uniref:NACHT domain-containing protein n=1 Tax=Streptomyces mutabilis TaxID=67332 RepID=UPI0022BA4578|nr:NACHT domain-containing protein [Streptomyces mutabilis]MCZ9348567.1 NACHT domain-containing protein [Streptomyces mutabilis]
MDPAAFGTRLAAGLVGPLVKRLFVREGPGAGLVDRPVRLSALVSFRGEQRTLGERELRKLVRELVERGAHETAAAETELDAVADALHRTLHALGDLDLDDVQAVRLGHEELAARLHRAAGGDANLRHLSADAETLHSRLLHEACLHILHFFTQRSAFVARTLVEQHRRLDELVSRTDLLVERTPSRLAEDTAFEERYARYTATRHSRLTIYGVDIGHAREWPLDTAYLSLTAARGGGHGSLGPDPSSPGRPEAAPPPSTREPVEHALAGHDRVLLRGVAGSGKTTLVQWLAVTAARQERLTGRLAHLAGRVPFVLPLRTLTRSGARLPVPGDFLTAVGCPLAGSQPPGWAERVLSAGRGVLLVDGVDEVPAEERARTRRWLCDLLAAFPHNRWLVTSRPSAVREEWLGGEDFTEFSLSPMSNRDVALFVRRWHEAGDADPALGEALLDAVRTKQDLGRLVTNPLMCALVCALHRERRGFLPRGRKALYDAALSMLLERRDRERELTVELDEESQVELLQRLAYWLIRNGRAEMSHADAVHQLERLLPAMPYVANLGPAEEILRLLLDRSGLLREPAPDAVEFVHRTFQDHLGARAAVEERDFDVLVGHAHLDQWEDVLRMAVAHARPDERARLLRGLAERGDREAEHRSRLHLLAMACLEHAPKLDPRVRTEVERRAGELIPPLNFQEATALADLGPIVLELLPRSEEVEDEQTAACVLYTAGLVGGDAALPLMTTYHGRGPQCRHQLGQHWSNFDTDGYASEVVRHLCADGDERASVFVRSPEELSALARLGGHSNVDLSGDFTPEQILQAVDERHLRVLFLLENSAIDDLSFLTRFRNLRQLVLNRCPNVSSLAPLARLPLEELSLLGLPRVGELEVLSGFAGLTTLITDVPQPVLDLLPGNAPLECLFLPAATRGITALAGFRSLRQLRLCLDAPLTREDREALAELDGLLHLSLDPAELIGLAADGVTLEHSEHVTVLARDRGVDLGPFAEVFPRAASLTLFDADGVDLAPLATHTCLRRVNTTHCRNVRNADHLPASLPVNPRRPH